MGQKVAAAESRAVAAEGDLRIEREWRISLQVCVLFIQISFRSLPPIIFLLITIGPKPNVHISNYTATHRICFIYPEQDAELAIN